MGQMETITVRATLALVLVVAMSAALRADEPSSTPLDAAQRAVALERAANLSKDIDTLLERAQYAAARDVAREALALRERCLEKDDLLVASSLTRLAEVFRHEGSYVESRQLHDRALAIRERKLGSDHPDVAWSLNDIALVLQAQGAYAEAAKLAERALSIVERARGPEHLEVASILSNLGRILEAQGLFARAAPLYERALAIRERALIPDDPAVADSLGDLAELHRHQGAYAKARPLCERALRIREKALGPDHPQVASNLNNLALILHGLGAYRDARPVLERAVATFERVFGKEHPEVAKALSNLSGLLISMGFYAEARAPCYRALEIREKAFGPDHPEIAQSLSRLGALLKTLGDYVGARRSYERALAMQSRLLGSEHPELAATLNNLAQLLKSEGHFEEARTLFERALAIREKGLGAEHERTAASMQNLAGLLLVQGRYAEARPLYERSLAARERALGAEHPEVASALSGLGYLLQVQGSPEEARPLFERALRIREKALGPEHPAVADSLADLAFLLENTNAYGDALPLCERALEIRERVFGNDHPSVARTLLLLTSAMDARGDRSGARSACERALGIQERIVGKNHPDYATCLNRLASLLEGQGLDAQATPLLRETLSIYERSLGEEHPFVSLSVHHLALLLARQGKDVEAGPLFQRALELTEREARAQIGALDGRQRLSLLRSLRYRLDGWLAFCPRLELSGYPEVLRFRGLVTRAETAERALARHAGGEDRALRASMLAVLRLASRLANEVPPDSAVEARAQWRSRYAAAVAERERLTLELSKRSTPLRASLERLTLNLADVQGGLAPGEALVDFLRTGSRYVAFVVRAAGQPVRIELGPTATIDGAAGLFVAACQLLGVSPGLPSRGLALDGDSRSSDTEAWRSAGSALRRLLIDPIEAGLLPGTSTLCVVPDGVLGALPLAALPGRASGAFLSDEYLVVHLTMAQDLVPRAGSPATARALLVGGVDYERAESSSPEARTIPSADLAGASDRSSTVNEHFPYLPQTLREVEGLRARLGAEGVSLLTGAAATEGRVRQEAKGVALLHIGTHGFAREDLLRGLVGASEESPSLSDSTERALVRGHDPMLLSGLALAGANRRDGAGGDDGILTALEASHLDLEGVRQVSLAACETARGTAEAGEGVLGLVSAFQMAGAQSVLASLWRVDDEATRLLMEDVYERVWRGTERVSLARGLRDAAVALRKRQDASGRPRFTSPRYWASFVAYGR